MTKKEAINFMDFLRIDFDDGRPQLLLDFVKYVTGLDMLELLGVRTKHEDNLKRQRSEE